MNLQLGRAIQIVLQTSSYLVYRAAVYGIICGVVAAVLLFLALIGAVFGGGAAMVLFVILAAAGGFGMHLLQEYVLYLMRAGHVAVITEMIEGRPLPQGVNQTTWGKETVMARFKEISVLALVDQLVKGIVRVLNRTLFNVMTVLPIPAMENAAKVMQKVVDFSLTYIDESILAHTFKTGNENVYEAAKSGIILYCQSWKALLKNAVALTLLSYLFTIVSALLFLIPLGGIALMLPETWGFARFALFILALFLGFSLKWIVFDPIACTSTILTFLKETEGMNPDPEWEERLEKASDKFRELKDKALSHLGKTPKPQEPPEAPQVHTAEAPGDFDPEIPEAPPAPTPGNEPE